MPTLVIDSQPENTELVCTEGRVFKLHVLHLHEINQGVDIDRDEGSPRRMIPNMSKLSGWGLQRKQ